MDIAKIRKKALSEGRQADASGSAETQTEPPASAAGTQTDTAREEIEETASPEPAPDETVVDSVREAAVEPAVTAPSGEGVGTTELLTFSLDKEEFALRVSDVEEIVRFQRITLLPAVPAYVLGITSLRGKIIPVIDLKIRLAIKKRSEGAGETQMTCGEDMAERKEKIIILSGPKGLIGAIIDRVMGVVRLTDDTILEPPPHLTEEETRFIEGVVIVDKRFISIIRAEDAMNIEMG